MAVEIASVERSSEVLPGAGRVFVTSRLFDAPRALVWAAWTDPAHLARWWGPQGARTTVETLELRVGGTFRLLMQGGEGGVYVCSGVFREIVPPARLVYDGPAEGPHACGAGIPPRSVVTVTFEEVGHKTRLTLKTLFDTESAHAEAIATGFAAGWPESLERLAASIIDPS